MTFQRNFPGIKPAIIAHVNCSLLETELGPCFSACNRAICLMKQECVRPIKRVQRNWWQRFQQSRRIKTAKANLAHALEAHQTHIANKYSEAELARERRVIGALRVDLSLAMR